MVKIHFTDGRANAGFLAIGILGFLLCGCIPGPPGLQGAQGPPGPGGEAGPQGPPGKAGALSLAGQQCREGKYMIGFDENGNILCAGDQKPEKTVGPDCTDPPLLVPYANLQQCNLSRMDLNGVELNHANLMLANLEGSDLSGADLSGSNISGASLMEVNLKEANLSMAVALKAHAGEDSALARSTNLAGAQLQNANLQGAFLVGANLTEVVWDHTQCPDGTFSDEVDGKTQTCVNNLIAMALEVRDVPPIGKEGTVTNAFGIGVKASIKCVTFHQDGSISQSTTMQEITMDAQSTHAWSGSCPSVPPQTSKITIEASPLLP